MDDRRTEPRFSHEKAAQILVAGQEPIACALTNSSPVGACLTLSVHQRLPDTFVVKVCSSGLTRQAEVTWRGRATLGVRFQESRR